MLVTASMLFMNSAVAADYGVVTADEFLGYADGCVQSRPSPQTDGCWFAQGHFAGALSGIISANRFLGGAITREAGCNGFTEAKQTSLFYEFRDYVKLRMSIDTRGRPVADLVLGWVFEAYPCPKAS